MNIFRRKSTTERVMDAVTAVVSDCITPMTSAASAVRIAITVVFTVDRADIRMLTTPCRPAPGGISHRIHDLRGNIEQTL